MSATTLETLTVKNFRCFDHHTIEFGSRSLIVGKNNAGKSTCIEALRMISLVTERQRGLNFGPIPRELGLPARYRCLRPSIEGILLRHGEVFHRFGNPPAAMTARFSNGSSIELYLDESLTPHAVVFGKTGKLAETKAAVAAAEIPRLSILPQIGPLAIEETRLTLGHVRSSLLTTRSSLHFRNQLMYSPDGLQEFRKRVENTWAGIEVGQLLEPSLSQRDDPIGLIIRDGDFSAEIAAMGHGVQMWLQIIWFLCRSSTSDVIVLDEPDVYMHADLQRKLIRMIGRQSQQVIVATHSAEMLAEVPPEAVIVLDRSTQRSGPATNSVVVQDVLSEVGSVHNLALARLGYYGRLLAVEGEDVAILKAFQDAISPGAPIPVDVIPNTELGGWSMWPSVISIARLFKENASGKIRVHCVLDRDYHTEEEVNKVQRQATDARVEFHIWSGKEIENYVLMPSAIARCALVKSGKVISAEVIEAKILEFASGMEIDTIDQYGERLRIGNKADSVATINRRARDAVRARADALGLPMVVGGKELIGKVLDWLQAEHGVNLNIFHIIRSAKPQEVAEEVKSFIAALTSPT